MESPESPKKIHLTENLRTQLASISSTTRKEFDEAERLIEERLASASASLNQSIKAIRMLLSAQQPHELESKAGIALHDDLKQLLANSEYLSQMAVKVRSDFLSARHVCEERTERQLKTVIAALEMHRAAMEDNAVALTEAALLRARTGAAITVTGRPPERRAR